MKFKLQFIILLTLIIIHINAIEKGELNGCYKKTQHEKRLSLRYVKNCFDWCSEEFYRYSIIDDSTCMCENILREAKIEEGKCNRNCTHDNEQIICGGDQVESIYETGSNLPGPVQNLIVNYTTEDKIVLLFDHPERNGTELTGYEAIAVVLDTYSKYEWARRNITRMIDKPLHKFELSELIPSTEYNITIISKNNELDGGKKNIIAATRLAAPSPISYVPKVLKFSNGTANVEIQRAINNNGPISKYLIVVHFVDNELIHDFDETLLDTYQKAKDDGLSYYITGEIDEFQEEKKNFIIGDGQTYGKYFNAPLPSGKHFHVLVGIASRLYNEEKITYSNNSHHDLHDSHFILTQIDDKSSENSSDAIVVLLTVACIICGLVLLGSILFYGYIKTKINPRINRFERHEMSLQGPILEVDNNGFIADVSGINFKEKLQEVLLSLDDDQKIIRKNLSLDIDNILGIGQFGDVIRGQLNTNIPCQVHVVSADDMDPPIQTKFIRDLNSLLQFGFHRNMLNFMGICQTHDWFFVVFEDTPATLKQFLLSNRQNDGNLSSQRATNLSENELIRLMYELGETIEYLHYNKIVHKNLNSYNVRIKRQNSAYTIKLSIFGPTLYNIGEDGIKNMVDEERWFAPEVTRIQKFSYKSDIFSFGLILWEICTLGATIYGSIATNDLFSRIKKGFRPDKYTFISEDLYQLMLNCWELDANERSEIIDVVSHLKQMQSAPNYYLNYTYDGQLPYYLPLLEIKN
ncbi:hypothetical protein PVAND_001289 [Polypedilum vanderplanki]|uniref:Tyrosine-protein kinase Wsck n=1 Tax=Polypedilum vanderplanki TaxID=319348 RepID=A0A9J6BNT4_POLVA|nr:hypothetical protein PVAND_001289 [Polypedilum vanderplanki]